MTDWSEKVLASQTDEVEILKDILNLHNGGNPVDADVTYSVGHMWHRSLPQPIFRSDLYPQFSPVVEADCRNLPVSDNSWNSIMFDPPFAIGNSKSGIIKERFSKFKTVDELRNNYRDSLTEFYRVLKNDGIVIFKCQDGVSGGTNYFFHFDIMNMAQDTGFYVKDLFVYTRKSVMWSPNMENQQNARKNHCYFIILQKNAKKLRKQK